MHLDQRRIRTFRGSPAEIVYQHQHAQLPLEQLEGVPQPIVALVMMLLEKDPLRRFQTPAELLRVIPTITDAIKSSQTVTYQSLKKMPAGDSYAVLHKPQAKLGPEKISIARLPTTGTDIFDREQDIAFLNDAWANQIVNVVTIVAWTRVGKSALVNEWLRRMAAEHYRSVQLVFGWSFRHGSGAVNSSADEFLHAALAWFGDPDPRMIETACEKGERLARLVAHRRTLLLLDGLDTLQYPDGPQQGRLRESSLRGFLGNLSASNRGLCVVTTRLPVVDIRDHERNLVLCRDLQMWRRWPRG